MGHLECFLEQILSNENMYSSLVYYVNKPSSNSN